MGLQHSLGCAALHLADGTVATCHDREVDPLAGRDNIGLAPCCGIIAHLVPACNGCLLLRVVALTLEHTCVLDGAIGRECPRSGIGDDGLGRAIGIGHNHLRHQRLVVAPEIIVCGGEGHITCIEARTYDSTQGVVALAEHRGHVVGMVGQGLTILAHAWVEPILAHTLAVDVELIDTHRGDV